MRSLINSAKKINISRKEKFFLVVLGLLFIYLLISSLVTTLFFRPTYQLAGPTTKININDHNYNVLTANTEDERERGLMYITKPVSYQGMQFLYSKSSKQSFWNQNTHLDLTLYWMQDDKVIGTADLPSIDHAGLLTVTSPKAVSKVVEIIR